MSWNDVFKVVVITIACTTGIGGILYAVIRFSANFIAERMAKKMQFAYTKRFTTICFASQEEKETYDFDDHKRSGQMMKQLETLSDEIREYLAQLDVAN